ncbi:hypothetical protein GY45DRAFT_1316324 [Cubamyces sp. BRFM 1775]|nr:hypothetical protein GY45DRAFT_1316324 [Cubamyces sp. BRFM 1775]
MQVTVDARVSAIHQPTLHSLPTELIERVLTFSDPRAVSRYAQTCRFARRLVYEPKDHFLWRELYLGRPFDDLRKAVPVPSRHPLLAVTPCYRHEFGCDASAEPLRASPWQSELQRRIEAEAIVTSGDSNPAQLRRAFETFLAAVDTALPVSKADVGDDGKKIHSRSETLLWLDHLLRRTRVLNRAILASSAESANESARAASSDYVPSPTRELRSTTTARAARPGTPHIPSAFEELHQLRCQLRAYVALAHESSFAADSRLRMIELRKKSRCFVYDMRKYQPETLWGPYRVVWLPRSYASGSSSVGPSSSSDSSSVYGNQSASDGSDSAMSEASYSESEDDRASSTASANGTGTAPALLVNWEHVEHILNVVALKLRDVPHACLGFYKKPLFSLEALRAYSAVGAFEREPHDWAGVTGKWRRFVCFMDYRDLYMFNNSHLPPGPHHPSFFEDPFDEALRPVELYLSLIPASTYFSGPSHTPYDPFFPSDLPTTHDTDDPANAGSAQPPRSFRTLYFEGHSHGPHASTASIRGRVGVLADGAVRWQFVTTYDGRMQWSAEGVQIGHVCSAAGIAGIWTGARHEHDDPAGPFWMVKVNDDLPAGVLNTLH